MGTARLLLEFENLQHKWAWLLALGIIMLALGTVAFFIAPAATIGTVLVLGWLLVVSGVVEAVQAFRMRKWNGIFLHAVAGILGILDWLTRGYAPRGRGAGMDLAVCLVLYRHRYFSSGRRRPAEISQLGVGRLRRSGHTSFGYFTLGGVALVRLVVSGNSGRDFIGLARMGLRNVCICRLRPAGTQPA